MRVNPNLGQQNPFLHVNQVNQSIAARTGRTPLMAGAADGRRDGAKISPMGKVNSVLEGLMKQRQKVNDAKNSLIGDTLEGGGTLDSIKAQLESYEEQLKNLDEQIAQTLKNDITQEKEQPEKKADEKPKTEAELQNQRVADLTNLSTQIDRAQTISSVKTDLEGEAKVLRSELSMSTSSEGTKARKEERLAEIEGRMNDLGNQTAGQLGDVAQELWELTGASERPAEESSSATERESLLTLTATQPENTYEEKTL